MKFIHHTRLSAFSLELNLLSDDDKKRIKSDMVLYVVRDVVLLMLFTITIVAILLVVSTKTLDSNYREIVKATTLAESEQPTFQQRVREIAEQSESLHVIQSSWEPISPYVLGIAESIGPFSTLLNLSIDQDQRSAVVIGHADTRTHVLEIAKRMESLPFVASVESPLSNILQPTNIQFQFTIRFKARGDIL